MGPPGEQAGPPRRIGLGPAFGHQEPAHKAQPSNFSWCQAIWCGGWVVVLPGPHIDHMVTATTSERVSAAALDRLEGVVVGIVSKAVRALHAFTPLHCLCPERMPVGVSTHPAFGYFAAAIEPMEPTWLGRHCGVAGVRTDVGTSVSKQWVIRTVAYSRPAGPRCLSDGASHF